MKNIVGGLAIVLLCGAVLAIEIAAAQWELHWVGHVLIAPFGVCMYYVTRWMRGPGSEFGTPVPTLNLTERALDDATHERG